MVTSTEIDLGENSGSIHLIKQIFDLGKGILVLDGYVIEFPVIHTEANGTVSFVHKNDR
jgi:hypothetical protein